MHVDIDFYSGQIIEYPYCQRARIGGSLAIEIAKSIIGCLFSCSVRTGEKGKLIIKP